MLVKRTMGASVNLVHLDAVEAADIAVDLGSLRFLRPMTRERVSSFSVSWGWFCFELSFSGRLERYPGPKIDKGGRSYPVRSDWRICSRR